jgi:hypothetical protein
MAELLAKKKETKLLLSITNERLGYLGINESKMRFWDAKKRGKAIGGNGGMTLTVPIVPLIKCSAFAHTYVCLVHSDSILIQVVYLYTRLS